MAVNTEGDQGDVAEHVVVEEVTVEGEVVGSEVHPQEAEDLVLLVGNMVI